MLSEVELYKLKDKTMGEKIRWLRQNKSKSKNGYMNTKDLAKVLEISSSTLNKAENGENCKVNTLLEIADYFEVSIDWLLSRKGVGEKYCDLYSVCKYTGLNENTIQFFNENKTDANYRNTVDFLEVLIDRLSYDIDYNFTFTDLKECTLVLSELTYYDDNCSIVDIDNQVEKYKNIDESINGKKYKLSQLFNDVLDEYSILDTGLNSIADLRFQIHNLFKKQKELLDKLTIETYAEINKEEMSKDIKDTLNEINEAEKAGEDNEKE